MIKADNAAFNITGVNWNPKRKMWRAYLRMKGGRLKQLGHFTNIEDAKKARSKALTKYGLEGAVPLYKSYGADDMGASGHAGVYRNLVDGTWGVWVRPLGKDGSIGRGLRKHLGYYKYRANAIKAHKRETKKIYEEWLGGTK